MYNEDEYICISEVAGILACSVSTVYKLLKQENSPLKHYRLGRHYKIRMRDVYEFIDGEAERRERVKWN